MEAPGCSHCRDGSNAGVDGPVENSIWSPALDLHEGLSVLTYKGNLQFREGGLKPCILCRPGVGVGYTVTSPTLATLSDFQGNVGAA